MRIGVRRNISREGLDAEVRAAIEKGIAALKLSRCNIKPVSLPHTRYAVPTYYLVATAEASANLARLTACATATARRPSATLSDMYSPFARRGLRGGSQAPHLSWDVCALRRLLRRLLPSRRSKYAAFLRGIPPRLFRRRRHRHAHLTPIPRLQNRREDRRSIGHVPR